MLKKLLLLLLCFGWILRDQVDGQVYIKPRLLFKFPTRDRVERFFSCLDKYYELMSHKYPFNFLITCDEDDQSMNNELIKKHLEKYTNLRVIFGASTSKIDACNRDMEQAPDFDILVLVSDDMIPVKSNYDDVIVNEMLKKFPDFDGVLNFNGTVNGGNLNTLAILGKKYYQRFNYIYHPDYKSFYCDLEMTMVSKILKKEVVVYNLIIEHQNPAFGKVPADKLFKKNYRYVRSDKKIFSKRLKERFGLRPFSSQERKMIARLIKE
jgi:hypothetical protein